MKCCVLTRRDHQIGRLALVLVLTLVEVRLHSAEQLVFSALDRSLHSLITNRQTSDVVLLQAISRLGPVTEPPLFWWGVLDDSSFPITHRIRALHALFRRHAETRYAAADLREVMGDGKWFHDATFTKVTYEFGKLPVEVNEGESVFRFTFFGKARIYIRVLGNINEETFAKALKQKSSPPKDDPIIIQYGYEDDYDRWYYAKVKPSRQP